MKICVVQISHLSYHFKETGLCECVLFDRSHNVIPGLSFFLSVSLLMVNTFLRKYIKNECYTCMQTSPLQPCLLDNSIRTLFILAELILLKFLLPSFCKPSNMVFQTLYVYQGSRHPDQQGVSFMCFLYTAHFVLLNMTCFFTEYLIFYLAFVFISYWHYKKNRFITFIFIKRKKPPNDCMMSPSFWVSFTDALGSIPWQPRDRFQLAALPDLPGFRT